MAEKLVRLCNQEILLWRTELSFKQTFFPNTKQRLKGEHTTILEVKRKRRRGPWKISFYAVLQTRVTPWLNRKFTTFIGRDSNRNHQKHPHWSHLAVPRPNWPWHELLRLLLPSKKFFRPSLKFRWLLSQCILWFLECEHQEYCFPQFSTSSGFLQRKKRKQKTHHFSSKQYFLLVSIPVSRRVNRRIGSIDLLTSNSSPVVASMNNTASSVM